MNNNAIRFLRRLGPPQTGGVQCVGCHTCPDILELEDGDFAVIGANITDEAKDKLPPVSGCGPGERIVRVPRRVLVLAKPDIPGTV